MYLSENEVGFHQGDLGFPSIAGCHAIVYVTANGLFGLHNFGGADQVSWQGRAAAFATFVTGHVGGPAAGKHLYGVCYATGGNSRGYGDASPKQVWTDELTAFATALNYRGPISGYNLTSLGKVPPVYVLYANIGATCVIQVKEWRPGNGATTGANASPPDHKMIARKPDGSYDLRAKLNVVTSVPTAGLGTVYPEKLRG